MPVEGSWVVTIGGGLVVGFIGVIWLGMILADPAPLSDVVPLLGIVAGLVAFCWVGWGFMQHYWGWLIIAGFIVMALVCVGKVSDLWGRGSGDWQGP